LPKDRFAGMIKSLRRSDHFCQRRESNCALSRNGWKSF